MITGIPEVDNGINDIRDNIIKSQHKNEEFKQKLITELKKANNKEKKFLIFKLIFNGLSYHEKITLIEVLTKNPRLNVDLWPIINEANRVRKNSENALYVRNLCCPEIIDMYKSLLDKISKLSDELNINNSLELSAFYSYLLWNGYLSKTKQHEYKSNDKDEICGLLFVDVINGMGVCRNYSEMLKDFLEHKGYKSVILENYCGNIKANYIMDIRERKIVNSSDKVAKIKNIPNHTFNLIEENGFYIYDPTNLLLYNLKDANTAILVNGKGKNKIYPYHSYDFCYSKEEEQFLDKLFSENKFDMPYSKTDFISTSEVTLELLRNSRFLLEDFYVEAKPHLEAISEGTKKVLNRRR